MNVFCFAACKKFIQRLDKLIDTPANHVLFSFVLSTEGQGLVFI